MEEQPTWKGHSFTLLVFGGIVVLCAIFFVLGMLVGRGQGQRSAEAALHAAAAKAAAAEAKAKEQIEPLSFPVDDGGLAVKTPAPALVVPTPSSAPPIATTAATAKTPAPVKPPDPKMRYLQVAALETSAAANKIVDELGRKGFPAIINSGDGANKLFRVRVGPFSNAADEDIASRKLKSMGYQPIRK